MKKIPLVILISSLILMLACKEKQNAEGSCIDQVSHSLSWVKSQNTPPWVDPTFTTFMEGGARIFQVETQAYGNVCPLNSVYAQAGTYIYKPYPAGSSFHVVFKYRYGDMMDHGNSEYIFSPEGGSPHYFDFSIQDAYSTGGGAFLIIIQWEMISPTSDPDADLAYFKEAFSGTSLHLNYSRF
jgi:hypothetical protein